MLTILSLTRRSPSSVTASRLRLSLVIAAKAVILNLLSVAAAYGVVVATFQYGWGQYLLNFKPDGAIVPWLPLFMFVILFCIAIKGLLGQTPAVCRNFTPRHNARPLGVPWVLAVVATPTEIEGLSEPSVPRG
jgi:hypothetical protein